MFILRALDRAGTIGYYTGKAGPEWVSNKLENAFTYESKEVAQRKATLHNRFESVHGMRFIALPA
jgi:hypothetical protein